tara:strand:- start:9541 stop:9831 length:291 start_codon:yes stop_codon:yes gene_type:complete
MANMKIKLLVSTKVGTGTQKRFVTAGEIIEVDAKIAKIMIANKIAIDSNAKVIEVIKDKELIIEIQDLKEEIKSLIEENKSLNLELANSKKVEPKK